MKMNKKQIIEQLQKILVNCYVLENMIKDGKVWHAGNKISGLEDQINLLAAKLADDIKNEQPNEPAAEVN